MVRSRWSFFLTMLLVLTFVSCGTPPKDEPADSGSAPESAFTPPPQRPEGGRTRQREERPERAAARGPAAGSFRPFWRQERLVTALEIGEDQIAAMDDQLAGYEEAMESAAEREKAASSALSEALLAGDLGAAAKAADELSAAAADRTKLRPELVITLLEELEGGQRTKLQEEFPGVLKAALGGPAGPRPGGRRDRPGADDEGEGDAT